MEGFRDDQGQRVLYQGEQAGACGDGIGSEEAEEEGEEEGPEEVR